MKILQVENGEFMFTLDFLELNAIINSLKVACDEIDDCEFSTRTGRQKSGAIQLLGDFLAALNV